MVFAKNYIIEELEKIDILKKNIPEEYLEEVRSSLKFIACKKGQQFIIEGAPVSGLYFICNGKAKVLKTGIYGKEQILRLVGEGEIIGHRGFGTQLHYSIAAVALEDINLCYLSNTILQEIFLKFPSFTYDLMLFYAKELNKSEAKIKSISQMTVRERVIDALLYVHRKFGTQNGYLNLLLSRKEYADYAGTSEEQVIRVLSNLKKEDIISTKTKHICIENIGLLKKEISEHIFYLDS